MSGLPCHASRFIPSFLQEPYLEVPVVHVVVRLARLVQGVQRDELARQAVEQSLPAV